MCETRPWKAAIVTSVALWQMHVAFGQNSSMQATQVVLPLLSLYPYYLVGGGLMDWAKTKASRTAMEVVSPIITSRDGRQRNKEGIFLTGSDLFCTSLFRAYKGHYYFWRKPASGSSMLSHDDVKQRIKDLNRKVWYWAQAEFVSSTV